MRENEQSNGTRHAAAARLRHGHAALQQHAASGRVENRKAIGGVPRVAACASIVLHSIFCAATAAERAGGGAGGCRPVGGAGLRGRSGWGLSLE